MKRLMIALTTVFICAGALTACRQTDSDTIVLRIANSEEYIDEGGWDEEEIIELENGETILGEHAMTEDFETWYEETYGKKVMVEYSTYGTNEELYNQMTLGNEFDLVCPSEYMIMKLMNENRVQPYSDHFFDKTDANNYYANGVSSYIQARLQELQLNNDTLDQYAAGYMWGTMGIVYNPARVSKEDVKHWSMLLNQKYTKEITMKDSVRDSYLVALCILNQDKMMNPSLRKSTEFETVLDKTLNDTSAATVSEVEKILSKMRENAYSLEIDSGKSDMVTGKVIANMQWSGDAAFSLDQAEEDGVVLNYSVPEECSNLWFDGWCMMKDGIEQDSRKQQAAEAFVNFISRPDNVVRNMYYIGYSSAISGGDSDTIFDYVKYCYGSKENAEESVDYSLEYFFGKTKNGKHTIKTSKEQLERQLYALYPTEDVLQRCAVMKCFDEDANDRISQMWINIRCFDGLF